MAANYTELKAEIQDWLSEDALLATTVDTLIDFVEAEVNNDKDFRTLDMNTLAPLVANAEFVDLPEGYLSFQYLADQNDPDADPLEFLTPEAFRKKGSVGTLKYYTIVGGQLRLKSPPTAEDPVTLEASYYQKIPALSDETTTNWLLQKSPQFYLYGALVHAEPYLENDARSQNWASFYAKARSDILFADQQARIAAGNLIIQMPEKVA